MRKVYDDGIVQLWHGDAVDVIEEVLLDRSVRAMITDPPYGQVYEDKSDTLHARGGTLRGDNARGGMRTLRRVLSALAPKWQDAAHLFTFCHFESYPDFFDVLTAHATVRNRLTWWKRGGSMGFPGDFARDVEDVIHATRGRAELLGHRDGCVLDFRKPYGADRGHPTAKPVPLLRYLAGKVARAGDSGVVIDPFAGSATTLAACRELGIPAVGIEIDERWIPFGVDLLNKAAWLHANHLPPNPRPMDLEQIRLQLPEEPAEGDEPAAGDEPPNPAGDEPA